MHAAVGFRRTAVAVALGTIALAGCHDTKRATTSNAPPPDRFQIRPVLAVSAAPCRADQVPGRSNQCYSLEPLALDARQVAFASSSFQRGGDGWGVDLVLTADGLRRFNALAAQLYGQPPPTNQLAFVIDGRVISAPALQTAHFDGNGVRVSGAFTEADAQHVANIIR